MTGPRFAIAALTVNGTALAQRVTDALGAAGRIPGGDSCQPEFTVFHNKTEHLKAWVRREFVRSDGLLFIGAAGIAVRMLDGLMRGKDKDPAVLVLDEKGEFVIPLLSGHLGGANRLARELAQALGARAVITTATDLNGVFAVDEWALAQGCVIDDISRIKTVSATLLRGESVGFHSDFPITGRLPRGLVSDPEPETDSTPKVGIAVSPNANSKPFPVTLNVIPRVMVLGAGCRKHTPSDLFERFVLEVMARHAVSVKTLKTLASLDIKRDESCFQDFARKYDLDFQVFSAPELDALPGTFTASAFVKERTGVDNVCERAALAGGGQRFVLRKTAGDGMTMALAISEWCCGFE